MSAFAPTLHAYLTERLIGQRHASPHTIAAYRTTLRLLLGFAAKQFGIQPCQLDVGDLDAGLIGALLHHLETERGNGARTRNARLAAPDRLTWTGRHDHALLALAIQTGLRASEITGLNCGDVHTATNRGARQLPGKSPNSEFACLFRTAGNAESRSLLTVRHAVQHV